MENQPESTKKSNNNNWLIGGAIGCLVFLFITLVLIGVGVGIYYISKSSTIKENYNLNNYDIGSNLNNSDSTITPASVKVIEINNQAVASDVKWQLIQIDDFGSTLNGEDAKWDYIDDISAHNGYKFVRAKMTITNQGTETLWASGISSIALVNEEQDYRIDPTFDANSWIAEGEEYYMYEEIAPGDSITVALFFEIPEDLLGWSLEVWGLDFSIFDDEKYIDFSDIYL